MQEFATCKAAGHVGAMPLLTCLKIKKAYCRQVLRIMKLTTILLLTACLHVSAKGFTQGAVNLSLKDATLQQVFSAVEKQTDYHFFYKNSLLQQAKKVTIRGENMTVEQVLEICFKDQPISYSINGKVVTINAKKKLPSELIMMHKESKLINVKGKVVNENGEAVLASILVKGESEGTTTNEDGEFQLMDVPEDAILVISGVGLETKEFGIEGKASIYIIVKISIAPLQETIIKGYYTTTRTLNTGNVSKVKSETIQRQPVGDPLSALIGRVPGLQIIQNSGNPGRSFTVRLRGKNSIANGSSPLFIVDGVMVFNDLTSLQTPGLDYGTIGQPSIFNSLNPSDIESVEILKDADATAIYGSRGANGVVLITTKKGKVGKSKVDLNYYSGFGRVPSKIKLLNTKQYLEMRKEAFTNDGTVIYPPAGEYDIDGTWDTTRFTDWQNELMGGSSKYNDVQLSLSGGNINTQFLMGAGYHKETTVYPGNFLDRKMSFHLSLNHQSENKKFKAAISTLFTDDESKLPASDLRQYITLPPDAPPIYDSAGRLNWENSTWNNPYGILLQAFNDKIAYLNSSLNLSYELFNGLEFKTSFGYTKTDADQIQLFPAASYRPSFGVPASANNGTNKIGIWSIEPQISFNKKIKNFEFNALLGSTFLEQTRDSKIIIAEGFANDNLLKNLQAASSISLNNVQSVIYKYNAFFGRFGLNYNNKYLINLTGRRDGSSRFGTNNKFANFGSSGIGWIFSNERFINKGIRFLSYGKIRGSYGITGNDQISDYQYLDTYTSYASTSTYLGLTGLIPTRLYNADYAWEENRKLEIGIDLGFFNNKLLLSADYYKNKTSNQLLQYPLPGTTGFGGILRNLPAVVQNSGAEFELNSTNIRSNSFSWTTSLNLTIPKNKLVSYPDIENSSYSTTYIVGEPLFIARTLQNNGVNPTTGLYTFEDFDKDGQITFPNDYHKIIFTGQEFYGGLQNSIHYKKWQLDIFAQFVKQNNSNNYVAFFQRPGTFSNQPDYVLNRWIKPGDIKEIQQFSNSNPFASDAYYYLTSSDFAYSDASFIRLKNISLSYSVPTELLGKIHFTSGKVYMQGQNLATITRYKGFDPENLGGFPPLRVITIGVQITF